MREFKIKSDRFTVDYSEASRVCTIYTKSPINENDVDPKLDEKKKQQDAAEEKLQRMHKDHLEKKITDVIVSAADLITDKVTKEQADEFVDILQEDRNNRIDSENLEERHTDHSTFTDEETGESVSILLNDHDIRISTQSAEDEYFSAIARKERDQRDQQRMEALRDAFKELKPEQVFILTQLYVKKATKEDIGKVLGKTGNAVSQNHKTILKKLKRYMDKHGIR